MPVPVTRASGTGPSSAPASGAMWMLTTSPWNGIPPVWPTTSASGRRNRVASAGKRRPERMWRSGGGGEELVLAGLLVLHEAVAAQLGQQLVALVGAGGDQLVVGVQHDVEARAVEVAAAAA